MRDMPVKILLKRNKWKFPEYYVSDIIYVQKKLHARFSYGAGVTLSQLIDIPILNSF